MPDRLRTETLIDDPSPGIKELGAFYTPGAVVTFLVDWAVAGRRAARVLDPACGDGRFLLDLSGAVGVDVDPVAARAARARCPRAVIHCADFFAWAASTPRRFDAVVGNPPFIRYQRFAGADRRRAQDYCAAHGVSISGLSSSWASFVVGAASMLRPGGRLALVVPAEISHANYARPVVRHLLQSFERVELFAPRRRLFPELSEDCWLLRCSGHTGKAAELALSQADELRGPATSWSTERIPSPVLLAEGCRLRGFLLPPEIRALYARRRQDDGVQPLGDLAAVGIGYVTGDNGFFHLRPSQAAALGVPRRFLRPSVRSSRDLVDLGAGADAVGKWHVEDRPCWVLTLPRHGRLPRSVIEYLDSAAGIRARTGYKCRTRRPWYSIPVVRVPDAFLAIMAQDRPLLVGNAARCTCTNSVHCVELTRGASVAALVRAWNDPLTELSCEIEGHHLGGGMLKLEPGEARAVLVPIDAPSSPAQAGLFRRGTALLRAWRMRRDR